MTWNFKNSYADLPEELFSLQLPIPVNKPESVLYNQDLASTLGMSLEINEVVQLCSGNVIPAGAKPLAQAYAGHQFGHFTMLGDGRAILLGEHVSPKGERYDIQLKGSGRTPYSRGGDGKATLYSMLREYLISESMHYLRVPTSRSLAVVKTGEPVYRQSVHPGAVLTRLMSSHIRVGTFEYIRQFHTVELLKKFMEYVINRHYPHLKNSDNPALDLLKSVTEKQIKLIVDWLRVGFIHGVMNTDNTSVIAETFDYGPCAFMNTYNPKTVFSSIDTYGRYAYGNQPAVTQWNLAVFAGTLLPLIHPDEDEAQKLAEVVIDAFPNVFNEQWNAMMCSKIGIEIPQESDKAIIQMLLQWMMKKRADYTNTFTDLRKLVEGGMLTDSIYQDELFASWQKKWLERLDVNPNGKQTAIGLMQHTNPVIIPRNHLVEKALMEGANGDMSFFHQLLSVLKKPYEFPDDSQFTLPPEHGDTGYQTFCGT